MTVENAADNVNGMQPWGAMPEPAEVKHIRSRWLSLSLLPLSIHAAANSQSVRSYINNAGGLSHAHLSTRGLAVKRSSTLNRLRKQQTAKGIRHLTGIGLSEAESKALWEGLPGTSLAVFVATISGHVKFQLPLACAFAAMLDDCCTAAEGSLQKCNVDAYRHQLCEIVDRLYSAVGMVEDSSRTQTRKMTDAINNACDWARLKDITDVLFEDMYFALICAIDVEWSAHYFPGMKASPTLHWFFPRFHPDMDPTNSKRLKRNVIVHPTRKLLEFCWAIARYSCSTHGWPKEAPQTKEIAEDCGLDLKQYGRLRKLMSGSAHATVDEIIGYWDAMFGYLVPKAPYGRILAPVPWITLALWMQQELITKDSVDRGTTVFVQSGESYAALWNRMRARWSNDLPRPGTNSWPRWITDQPSRPDWIPSSQSSGLSSSPRDCQ